MAVIVYAADSIITDSYIQTGGEYRSSDGSPGLDISKNGSLYNFTYKDGLLTELTDADMIYGEMYNYTVVGSPWVFGIATQNIYYNMSNFTAGDLNGFRYIQNVADEGDQLEALVPGKYKVSLTMSFSSSAVGGLYGIGVTHNWNVSKHRECYSRREAAAEVGNVGVSCIMDLDVGDKVIVQVENEQNTRNMNIHTMNVNLVKIGS